MDCDWSWIAIGHVLRLVIDRRRSSLAIGHRSRRLKGWPFIGRDW
jgi:hypothetical protein